MSTFSEIVKKANEIKASDIHISEGNYIGLRVFGKIEKQEDYGKLTKKQTIEIYEEITQSFSTKSKEYYNECLDKEGTVGFGLTYANEDIKFRVNAATYKEGYYIVLRRNEANPPLLANLNFYEDTLIGLNYALKQRSGLFLVVGQTGSGKSTTLAAMLREINENEEGKNIVTLEDPIEYEHIPVKANIVQKEIGRDLKTFDLGLKAAMREDPDIILLGEIRDKSSLNAALKLSETGHLIFATLHTDNAISTIDRIVAMSDNAVLTRNRLSAVMIGVIAQKLVPSPDGKRILLWEMLITDQAIKNNIAAGELNTIKSSIDSLPMSQSFNKTLVQHLKNQKLRKEDIFKYTTERDSLLAMLA